MKKKILVTGGAGFIGTNLCRRLLEDGNTVYCMDSLISGSEDNIKELFGNPSFSFVKGDICDGIPFKKIDEIYNCACIASPLQYSQNALKTLETNFIGVRNILEFASVYRAKVLQTSTSEIYGQPLVHPQSEGYFGNVNTYGPRSCYDEGKRVAEALCYTFQQEMNLDVKIVRIFNTYGPYMSIDDGRVVSNFAKQALLEDEITIYGDGEQTRSFCYVDDLIEGLVRFMELDEQSGPMNLGNPCEITINEIAEIIKKKTKSNAQIVYKNSMKDDPTRRRPDISYAKEKLNWSPCVQLDEGLNKTLYYFRKKLLVKDEK